MALGQGLAVWPGESLSPLPGPQFPCLNRRVGSLTHAASWLHARCTPTCTFAISKVASPFLAGGHWPLSGGGGCLSGNWGPALQGGSGLMLPDDWCFSLWCDSISSGN